MGRNTPLMIVAGICLFVGLTIGTAAGYFLGLVSTHHGTSPTSDNTSNRDGDVADLPNVRAVTTKEIETFGDTLTEQRLQMRGTFSEVSDTWVRLLLRDDRYVGFFIHDSKGELFQYAFANKEKYAHALLSLTRGDPILLMGSVAKVDSRFVFIADQISGAAKKR